MIEINMLGGKFVHCKKLTKYTILCFQYFIDSFTLGKLEFLLLRINLPKIAQNLITDTTDDNNLNGLNSIKILMMHSLIL